VPASAQPTNPPADAPQTAQPAPVTSAGPNANPLDLFPQVAITLFIIEENETFWVVHLTLCNRVSLTWVLVLLVLVH